MFMSIMAFQIESKEMYPIFVFIVLLVTWQACAQQPEKNHSHTLCRFMSSLCACPASSASIEYFFNIWFGMDQN